jgi:hypothetical protein
MPAPSTASLGSTKSIRYVRIASCPTTTNHDVTFGLLGGTLGDSFIKVLTRAKGVT